jgi:hypothetical protein
MVRDGAITAPVAQGTALQEGRMRGTARFGLVLLSVPVWFATAGAELSIYSVREKPSSANVQDFLKGGVSWTDDHGETYDFWADGTANHEDVDYSSVKGESRCQCQRRGIVAVNAGTIRFDCPYSCKDGVSSIKDFSLRAMFAARDALVYRDSSGRRVVARNCSGPPSPAVSRTCPSRSVEQGGRFFLVEIVPGASDTELYQAVRKQLQHADGAYDEKLRRYAMLFEGPPARTPRAATEIFFANGKEDAAALVAEALEVVIGPVSARPWPGSWDYDVIVVVGARKAAAAQK